MWKLTSSRNQCIKKYLCSANFCSNIREFKQVKKTHILKCRVKQGELPWHCPTSGLLNSTSKTQSEQQSFSASKGTQWKGYFISISSDRPVTDKNILHSKDRLQDCTCKAKEVFHVSVSFTFTVLWINPWRNRFPTKIQTSLYQMKTDHFPEATTKPLL